MPVKGGRQHATSQIYDPGTLLDQTGRVNFTDEPFNDPGLCVQLSDIVHISWRRKPGNCE